MSLIVKASIKGISASLSTFAIYIVTVIVTTPNFPPHVSTMIAINVLGPFIATLSAMIGINMFLSAYARSLGCTLKIKKGTSVGNATASVFSAFSSFFTLIPLGCCTFWLYVLQLLPSFLGIGFTGLMAEQNIMLAYLSLIVVALINIMLTINLIRFVRKSKFNNCAK